MDTAIDFTSVGPSSRTRIVSNTAPRLVGLCYRLPSCTLPGHLTAAERRIVRGLLAGESNHFIALRSGVSARTIAVQLNQLYEKMDIGSRYELLVALLGCRGEHLTAEYLCQRSHVFNASVSVFDVKVLFGDCFAGQSDGQELSFGRDATVLWRALLDGERAVVARRRLGDLHFIALGDRGVAPAEALFVTATDLTLLKGLGSGLSNRRLASDLGASQSALSVLSRHALAKLGLSHRAELLRLLSAC